MKFSNGEVFLFLHLVEDGDILTLHLILHQQCLLLLPAFCMYRTDMDELTHNVSEWGGVSVPTTHQSQHSHGGSRMEQTWRTATELNMPNSPKSPNSVQEVFHEVSEPNPMGNAVMSEETHGNAVAGAAAASAVTQPPVDTASLASSHTNKHHRTRHTSLGQSHHSSASVPPPPPPPPPPPLMVGNDA